MQRLLRSVIDVDGGITPENLLANFQHLYQSQIEWNRPEDRKVYDFLVGYFQQRLEMPSMQVLEDHFAAAGGSGDVETLERLEDIKSAATYIRTNYVHLLKQIREEQSKNKAVLLLRETHDIITRGVEFREGPEKIRKFGLREGLEHFAQSSMDLVQTDYNARTKGSVRQDGQQMWDEYNVAKTNKAKVWGKFTGLNEIDRVCHGIKPGEMWVHAGFPGELKTMFALNWAYNLATRYRTNTAYWSLEMSYENVRRQIYSIHSAHLRWRLLGYKPLDYRKIRDGGLTPEEEEFYKLVIEDFTTNPEYCDIDILCPDHDVTTAEIKMETEIMHKQKEIGLLVIDHGLNVVAGKGQKSKDYVTELNRIVRDTKKVALHFNHGEKIAVCLLFQLNRAGKEEADKNEGRYRINALTYANEVEKSADVITTTYLNEDHRTAGTTVLCNLKNRDNPLFAPFTAKVNFEPRRIYNLDPYQGLAGTGMGLDDHRAAMQAMDLV